MIYLFNRADGNQTEGIGAVAQCQIHTYSLSKLLGVEFASTKFQNLQHYQEHDTQENFCKDVTNFFNFPNQIEPPQDVVKFEHINTDLFEFISDNKEGDDVYVEIGNSDMMKFADSNADKWSQFIPNLANCVTLDESKQYFDDNKLNISLHITNFIEGRDNDRSESREQFVQGNSKEKYYVNLLQKFDEIFNRRNQSLFVDKEYHIYSRSQTPGDLSQFEAFTKLGLPIRFHIDEHPIISLYHLINSDVKVLSNSSFSYISALYGKGLSISRTNFHHKIPENVLYSDYDGNFDESQIAFE
tara:strand:- start:215 stop:1114 length:900 start_codon:yes stop_codon:yes gene_type:complete